MIVGISHIARTMDWVPKGYAFCEHLPNHPFKMPFLSKPHEDHIIAFFPGKPATEFVKYPYLTTATGFLDTYGAVCTALLSTNIAKDAKSFSDCFTTEAFPVFVNNRKLLIQLFRTSGGEFIELVQPT